MFNMKSVEERLQLWEKHLPDVEVFYAIKSNCDDAFAKYMIEKGHKFDCASKNEIMQVIKFGCLPENIIYANPVKCETHLEYAKEVGVK